MNYNDSKKTIFDLVNLEPADPYWMTKGLILLSDNYLALKDNFQAKTTLQSVIADSDLPELVAEAQAKLNAILASEKPAEPPPQEPMKLEFNNKDGNNGLFKEEIKKEEPKKEELKKEGPK